MVCLGELSQDEHTEERDILLLHLKRLLEEFLQLATQYRGDALLVELQELVLLDDDVLPDEEELLFDEEQDETELALELLELYFGKPEPQDMWYNLLHFNLDKHILGRGGRQPGPLYV